MLINMKCLWLIPIISLLHGQNTQGSPLDLASLNASNSTDPTSDASTVPAALALNLITNAPVISNFSRKGAATSGLVTIFKTIELIPQPVSGNSSARSSGFSDRYSGASARQSKLPTNLPSLKPSATSELCISLNGQAPVPYAADQLDKSSMLQPIIVGGITYAPENGADHASRSDGYDHVASRLWQGEAGLPPVVVGGLTYTQLAKGLQSGMLSGSALAKASKAFVPLGGTTISATGTNLPIPGPNIVDNGSTISVVPGGLVISSSIYPFATPSPTTAVTTTNTTNSPIFSLATTSSQLIIPASPSTFIIASQTFTAYPSGLAIDGTEVFQGSTAITVSGTTISLGRSDIVIGTSTVPFASITGLGAALSSGLVPTVTDAPGLGSGSTATTLSANKPPHSDGGDSGRNVDVVMVWLVTIAFFIAIS